MKAPQMFVAVPKVTAAHAEKFVRVFIKEQHNSGAMSEAITQSEVMTWPTTADCVARGCDSPGNRCEHVAAVMETEDEIENLIEKAIGPALRAAFIEAAKAVLHPAKGATRRGAKAASRGVRA